MISGPCRVFRSAILPVAGFLILAATASRAGTEIALGDIRIAEIEVAHLSVDKSLIVHIEAVGGEYRTGVGMFAYPWIIDAKTRDLVWTMEEEVTEKFEDSPWLRTYADDLRLRPGQYELYYYAGTPNRVFGDFEFDGWSDFVDNFDEIMKEFKVFYNESDKELQLSLSKLSHEYYVRLSTDGSGLHKKDGRVDRRAGVSIVRPDNDSYEKAGFTLTADANIEIYALGEYWASDGSMVDWGWITDAHTGGQIWEMQYENTNYAGGAEKNRRYRDRLFLRAGDYVAYYVTDGSHTYGGWNSSPPYDPEAWGLQIVGVTADDRSRIQEYVDAKPGAVLVRLTGVGDNELRSETFKVTKSIEVRVHAEGEYNRYSNSMADFAWIVTADGDQTVWVMTCGNSTPAGGAAKNLAYDGVVALGPGEYTVCYVSDGSHSYADGWNDSPPHDQKAYGVTLYAINGGGAFEHVGRPRSSEPGILVALTCDTDDNECSARFTIPSPTRVRIRAMGEGHHRVMADYGWIVNITTGDVVWEMTYRKTSHAGGADKNRRVDQVILLDKGEYALHFVTDGSHSPEEWNAEPPIEPIAWGIALTKVEQEQ